MPREREVCEIERFVLYSFHVSSDSAVIWDQPSIQFCEKNI